MEVIRWIIISITAAMAVWVYLSVRDFYRDLFKDW